MFASLLIHNMLTSPPAHTHACMHAPRASRRSRDLAHPATGDGGVVVDDLAVGGPAQLDRIRRMDATGARVSRWTEPVLLRRGGGSRADAGVSGAGDGVAQHLVDKLASWGRRCVGRVQQATRLVTTGIPDQCYGGGFARRPNYNGGGRALCAKGQVACAAQRAARMMGSAGARTLCRVGMWSAPFPAPPLRSPASRLTPHRRSAGDDLEWTEELGGGQREVGVGGHDGLNRHVDGGGRHGSIAVGDGVAGQRSATKGELRTGQLKAGINVLQDLGGRPGQHGRDGQVGQRPLGRLCAQLVHDAQAHPLLVRHQHRLRRALLAGECVRVLIGLPDDVVHVGRIGAKHLRDGDASATRLSKG
eukprot:scaffold7592_cov146-Isochrysis_galbana.AAC.1